MSYNRYINNFPNESEFTKYIVGDLADVPNTALIDDTGEMKYTKSFVDYYVLYGTTSGTTDFMLGKSAEADGPSPNDCIQVHVVAKPDGNNEMYVKQGDILKTPTNFSYTAGFAYDKIISISKWEIGTKWVTTMNKMFAGCSSLNSLNVSKFDTSLVDDMEGMFQGCSSLNSLEVSSFDTGNVTTMNRMFSGCSKLENLNVSNFNTLNVTTMERMFANCERLTSLDVSSFTTYSVTNMTSMFDGCFKLNKLYLSKNFFNSTALTEYDFGELTAWTDAESLAKFVEAITARDGAGKTVVLSIETQRALTQTQKDAITAKGWTIDEPYF